jgi:hypothetical protein
MLLSPSATLLLLQLLPVLQALLLLLLLLLLQAWISPFAESFYLVLLLFHLLGR